MDSETLSKVIGTATVIAVFTLLYLLAGRAGQRFVSRMSRQEETGTRVATLWSMVRRVLLMVVVVVGLLTVLSSVWGLAITPFLAVGSAVGVALGFGAQKLVQDVISGFFLLVEDQFRIGDLVELVGVSGQVQDIRLRVTVLRDVSGNVHYVPNGDIRVATNRSQDRRGRPNNGG